MLQPRNMAWGVAVVAVMLCVLTIAQAWAVEVTPVEEAAAATRGDEAQGQYFAQKEYVPQPLPTFAETKAQLPSPIFDENPVFVQMYWKTWELAFRNFYEPRPGSGFVSQFIDAAFNENIFLWDTCFLTMFCNYGHPLVPGIGSLDNFYARQHEDGEICREIDRATRRGLLRCGRMGRTGTCSAAGVAST